jgi:hypothetical protein
MLAGIDHGLFALAGRARSLIEQGVLMQNQFEGLSGHQADAPIQFEGIESGMPPFGERARSHRSSPSVPSAEPRRMAWISAISSASSPAPAVAPPRSAHAAPHAPVSPARRSGAGRYAPPQSASSTIADVSGKSVATNC